MIAHDVIENAVLDSEGALGNNRKRVVLHFPKFD